MNNDFTQAELKQLFKTLKAHRADELAQRDLAVYEFLLETGLRISEFAASTRQDAERWLADGRLYIAAEKRKGVKGKILKEAGVAVLNPLTQKALRVTERNAHCYILNNAAAAALRQLLALNPIVDGPLVAGRKEGMALSVRSYQARLAEWAAKAGLPADASPHWFRHTKARQIMRETIAKDPYAQVAYALGQSSTASARIYATPGRSELEEEAQRLEGLRSGRQPKREYLKAVQKCA